MLLVCAFAFQIEKLYALGHRAIILVAKAGKAAGPDPNWLSHVLHPKWQLTKAADKCLEKMKELYEVVVNGKLYV